MHPLHYLYLPTHAQEAGLKVCDSPPSENTQTFIDAADQWWNSRDYEHKRETVSYTHLTTNAEQIRFYKNGRIDVRFKDSAAAESCFKRLHLDEITLRAVSYTHLY